MKVLLVGNYPPDGQQSMSRYAMFLRDQLQQRGYDAQLILPQAVVGRVIGPGNPLAKWVGYVDKYIFFPPRLRSRSRHADLVHVCDHSNSPYLRWAGRTPAIITAHDMLAIRSATDEFPENPTGRTGKILQAWILRGLQRARALISVSEKTKRDLQALLAGDKPITVIHHTVNWDYAPATAKEIDQARAACGLQPGDEYLLHVGANQWYKNRPGAMKIALALRQYPRFAHIKLLMAGRPWTDEMRSIQREHNFNDAIAVVAPNNTTLRSLYSGATALLFPSREEGFGWPILEAQACGCPVITSARQPMMEIAGEGAILIDPENPHEAARVIEQNWDEREQRVKLGFENLKHFGLEQMMSGYCRAYDDAIAAHGLS
jgi:glycosyltransferase involved in cell wall biosynthesis